MNIERLIADSQYKIKIKLDRLSRSSRLCSRCCSIKYIYEGSPEKVAEITIAWYKCFIKICKKFNINRRGANLLFRHMCVGNWKKIHLTTEEYEMTANEWLDIFLNDLFYCSDRWSVDRLMRVHWAFRQYVRAAEKMIKERV